MTLLRVRRFRRFRYLSPRAAVVAVVAAGVAAAAAAAAAASFAASAATAAVCAATCPATTAAAAATATAASASPARAGVRLHHTCTWERQNITRKMLLVGAAHAFLAMQIARRPECPASCNTDAMQKPKNCCGATSGDVRLTCLLVFHSQPFIRHLHETNPNLPNMRVCRRHRMCWRASGWAGKQQWAVMQATAGDWKADF
jgi:hypothetical protein